MFTFEQDWRNNENELTGAAELKAWALSQHTDTSKTPRLHGSVVVYRRVGTAISSAMISFLHGSVHPPEMEINPAKTACGYPYGWVICIQIFKEPCNYLPLWNAFVDVQSRTACDPQSAQLVNTTTTTESRIPSSRQNRRSYILTYSTKTRGNY